MRLGIVGLPNVGKSTLFNAITKAGADCANYPFCTIEPNVGVVPVPDKRLDFLEKLFSPKKYTPAVIEFVDIAGLVRGASKGEGLGNKFLSHIRATDAIIHVVRCFDDGNVTHVEGECDPARDIEIIDLEMIISDMEMVRRRIDKAEKAAKGDRRYLAEAELFRELAKHLDNGEPAGSFICSEEQMSVIRGAELLTFKKVIYAANLDEEGFSKGFEQNRHYLAVEDVAQRSGARVMPVCAKLEAEISELPADEKDAFLEEMGLEESGLDRLIRCSYDALGLISFLTAGADEVRAWTIKAGTRAPAAAGKIHSDFERGFIRAEIIAFDDLFKNGTMSVCRERGLIRSEGKDYVMRDGDVTLFRFNV